jgi:acetolactate synthase-1/2/3 large subunit
MSSCAEGLIQLLESYGVDHVFGIPGVHTLELYRALGKSGIRHVTARHEQGAGFMADGYARMTGKPGVCFVITGPGLTNIATAMAQAMGDSIPLLVFSSVNRTYELGMGQGRLHELPSQSKLASSVSLFSQTLLRAEDLPKALARAFNLFASQRPGPVHIEIPIDVIRSPMDFAVGNWPIALPPSPAPQSIEACSAMLAAAERPIIIVGGGAIKAGKELKRLAEKLDAPVVNTVNAKGLLPYSHPLAMGGSPSSPTIRREIEQADVILAIGTELAETDFDFYFLGDMKPAGSLIRIDIDAAQLSRNIKPALTICSDAGAAVEAINDRLQKLTVPAKHGAERALAVTRQLQKSTNRSYCDFFAAIRDVLPEVVIVGDSTQPTYHAWLSYETEAPRRYFHSASGYGTLGYAIPAAIGAQLGAPEKSILAIIGDGGAQFTISELASAVELEVPVIFVVWNNFGYGEIRRCMEASDIEPIGVDIHTPDFVLLGRGFGCATEKPADLAEFRSALAAASLRKTPTLIEIVQDRFAAGYFA